jgi:hypothetical protein
MEYTESMNDAATYQSNIRAEDGMQPVSHWNALYEGVLIPVGTLAAVVVAMLGMMLLNK